MFMQVAKNAQDMTVIDERMTFLSLFRIFLDDDGRSVEHRFSAVEMSRDLYESAQSISR